MTDLRILLADDHAVVRAGLRALIDAQPGMQVIGEADNGLTACQRATELKPDIVIMDASMPHLNGAQATGQLKRDCPEIKVLTLTVHEEIGYLGQLLEAGASGYVLKRSAADELIHAIRVVARGGVYLDPHLTGRVVTGFIRKESIRDALHQTDLSERETEVLRLIGRGYSNKEIAVQLGISIKTVETHRSRSMEKLDLHSRVEIVRYAMQQGWLDQ